MRIVNETRGFVLADEVEIPKTTLARMRGLLGRSSLPEGHAMLLTACRFIHTFFMRFTIDVVFLDKHYTVVRCITNLPPYRLSPIVWRASMTLELPAGSLATKPCQPGDKLAL